ncbi:MAG: beta galactosidase jelly roll domain-containing protein [Cyclobacteriaceae bacterium]
MKSINLILILSLAIVFNSWSQSRTSQSLSGPWKFFKGQHHHAQKEAFNDVRWRGVRVPHTWNLDVIEGTGYYKGEAWYRKAFQVPSSAEQGRVFVRFDGVLTSATVYLNGQEIGEHHGGYAAFAFELTDLIKYGETNQLSVKVDNADNKDIAPSTDKLFTRFGGIYRDVNLIFTDQVCITPIDYASPGVYLTQNDVSAKSAEIDILTRVDNGSDDAQTFIVSTKITDAVGKVVWKKSTNKTTSKGAEDVLQKAVIKKPHLWNGKKDPYLYKVTISLLKNGKEIDQIEQPLGLRYYHIDSNEGFFLNGEYIDLQGVCRHQEWQQTGSALSDDQHKRDMELIEEVGANTIRLAHYQQAEIMYDMTDSNGIVVWAEVPITPDYQKGNEKFKQNCKQQISELIRQNYNHPSILFWGMYNEVWGIPIEDVQEYQDHMKAEDPNRLTTAASNRPLVERHGVTDLMAWNRYFAWYKEPDNGIAAWFDDIHEKEPNFKLAVSEYGAGGSIAHQRQELTRPNPKDGQFYPEQYQCYVHEVNYKEINDRKYLWGKYLWNMFDFSWPRVDRGDAELINHKGLVTYDREVKKDVFYFYKANWSEEPVLYITSKRHVFRDNPITIVKVYSNAENLVLTLNGQTISQKPEVQNKAYVWKNLELIKGENKIELTAEYKGRKIQDSCTWIY